MNQMCSGVDFFGLICDLAANVKGQWRQVYPDLANRQSMWGFLRANRGETRVARAPVGLPYILHTFDESSPLPASQGKCHIVGLRTKLDLSAGQIGGKLAFYWEWGMCSTLPDATPPDPEFYDYDPQTTDNTSELGNVRAKKKFRLINAEEKSGTCSLRHSCLAARSSSSLKSDKPTCSWWRKGLSSARTTRHRIFFSDLMAAQSILQSA